MVEFNATLLVSIISFVFFIIIMNAIFYNPVLNIMKKREDYINSNIENSQSNLQSVEEIEQSYRKEFEQAKTSSRKILNEKIEQAQKDADNRILEAKKIAKENIKSQKDDLYNVAQQIKNEIDNKSIENLVNTITSKILNNTVVK